MLILLCVKRGSCLLTASCLPYQLYTVIICLCLFTTCCSCFTNLDFQISLLDAPNNTSVSYSGPVEEGSSVTLTCNTIANPAVDSYTWYKVDGDQVIAVGSKKRLSTTVSEVDSQFYCKVSNRYGAQNSSITQIDVQCKSE